MRVTGNGMMTKSGRMTRSRQPETPARVSVRMSHTDEGRHMMTVWMVRYEWRQTGKKRWEKRTDYYVGSEAYATAKRNAESMARSEFYRNVTTEVEHAYVRGELNQ